MNNGAIVASPVHFAKHVCFLSSSLWPCRLGRSLYSHGFCPRLGYSCVCLVRPPERGVLEDQGDGWPLAPGLPPLPPWFASVREQSPRLCCLAVETVHLPAGPCPLACVRRLLSEVTCSFLSSFWVTFLVEAKASSSC